MDGDPSPKFLLIPVHRPHRVPSEGAGMGKVRETPTEWGREIDFAQELKAGLFIRCGK